MGDGFQTLADIDAGPDDAQQLADLTTRWLVSSGIVVADRTNGAPDTAARYGPGPRCADALVATDTGPIQPGEFSVVTARTVFHPGVYIGDDIACPHCGALVGLDDMSDTVGLWYDGGDGIRICAGCNRGVGLNDWLWDPAWAFGYLGFTFLSWPRLSPSFVAEVSARLGHRVVWVDGCW